MANQKTGRVTLKVNGTPFQSKKGAAIKTGGVKRTPDISDQGRAFFTEESEPSECTFTIMHVKDTDLEAIKAMVDVQLDYECDTGLVYTIPHAFYQTDGGIKNGEVELTFGGDPAIQHR